MKITIRTIDIIFTYKICRQNAKTPFVFAKKKSFTKRSPEIQYFLLLVRQCDYADFLKRDLDMSSPMKK